MAGFLELTSNRAWMQTVPLPIVPCHQHFPGCTCLMESLVTALSLLILFICLAVDCEQWAERWVGEAKQLWEFKTSHIKKEMNLDCRCTQGYSPCLAYTRTWVSLPHHIIEMLVSMRGTGSSGGRSNGDKWQLW